MAQSKEFQEMEGRLGEESPAAMLFAIYEGIFCGVVATKAKNENKWIYSIVLDQGNGIIRTKNSSLTRFYLTGIGNYGEFIVLAKHFEDLAWSRFNKHDYTERFFELVITDFIEHLVQSNRFRKYTPYSVELGVMCAHQDENGFLTAHMFRIKPDGDFHPVTPFCVLGGRGKTIIKKKSGREQPPISWRRNALNTLAKYYVDNNIPKIETVDSVLAKLFADISGEEKEFIIPLAIVPKTKRKKK